MTEPGQTERPHWTAGSVALIVIGLLILIPSGLCTTIIGIGSVIGMLAYQRENLVMLLVGLPGTLIMPLLIGGPFMALGAFLIHLGWRRRKSR
jgi:hypothetical protein